MIPVVVFTSSSAPQDIQDCYERHANCYVLKPFDFQMFTSVIQKIEDFWSGLVQQPSRETASI